MAHRLRPIEIDRFGLNHAIETLLDTTATTTGLRVLKRIADFGSVRPSNPAALHYFRDSGFTGGLIANRG